MFLTERRNEMFRKIAIIIAMFFFCLGLDNCKSPEEPRKPEPNYEYRYDVEVIYTRPDNAEIWPGGDDSVLLQGILYYPAATYPYFNEVSWMNKTGGNTYKYLISKVYVQKPGETKHQITVDDLLRNPSFTYAENISVQGAYDLEARTMQYGTALLFRMAKD